MKAKITKQDRDWAKDVKERDKCCLVCGSTERLNAHHLIPREITEFKYDLSNGITLCPNHHRFSFKISAHQNPIAFWLWFAEKYPMWALKTIGNVKTIK